MIKKEIDIAIIGSGPAGLSAAISAKKSGVDDILIIERDDSLGGILKQCIHTGFGIEIFKESLTGPEYAQRYIDEIEKLKIPFILNSMVVDMNNNKELLVCTRNDLLKIKVNAIILAMGCRERTRGAISIPGSRPAGIYTAGVAQNFINLQGKKIGKKAVILGSGDVGLIMARTLTLEGTKVLGVVEILPYPSGLPRNIHQCLDDFDIPLFLNHTVIDIEGDKRIKSVTIAKVDENRNIIKGTEKVIECDTLLISVGLIPENELSKKANIKIDPITQGPIVDENFQTSVEGIFACGNVLHVYDVVDYVTVDAEKAGASAANYIKNRNFYQQKIKIKAGNGILYVVPQIISGVKEVTLSMRALMPGKDKYVVIKNNKEVIEKKLIKRINPSEMIRINLENDELKNIRDAKELVLCIENE